jgi:hypothetical protein
MKYFLFLYKWKKYSTKNIHTSKVIDWLIYCVMLILIFGEIIPLLSPYCVKLLGLLYKLACLYWNKGFTVEWVIEWLLSNTNSAIFQLYHGENKIFSTRWWWSLLCTRPTPLVCIFIVLDHWNNSLWIDMLTHSDPLSWLQANQSLLFLINTVCLAEKQQIPIA